MAALAVTFTWPESAEQEQLTVDPIPVTALTARDPHGASLLAGSARNAGGSTTEITLSAEIGDGQYMLPSLCAFLCDYVRSGELVCPHDAELHDCMLGIH